jgi:hypothetical protein
MRSKWIVVAAIVAMVMFVIACFAFSRSEQNALTSERLPVVEVVDARSDIDESPTRTAQQESTDATKREAIAVERRPIEAPTQVERGIQLRIIVRDALDPDLQLESVRIFLSNGLGEMQFANDRRVDSVEFLALTLGEYRVHATAADHLSRRESVTVIAGESVQSFELALERSPSITVRWRSPNGQPFADPRGRGMGRPLRAIGIEVLVTGIKPDDAHDSEMECLASIRSPFDDGRSRQVRIRRGKSDDTKSAAAGPGDVLGVVSPDVPLPLWFSAWFDGMLVDVQRVEPGSAEVVFTSDPSELISANTTVRLRVLDDASNQPIAGVNVRVMRGTLRVGTKTNFDGACLLPDVPLGLARVDVYLGDRLKTFPAVQLSAKRVNDLGDVRLGGSTPLDRVHVNVKLLDPDGDAARRVQLGIRLALEDDLDERPRDGEGIARTASTDDDGSVRFDGLMRGRFVLRITDDRFPSEAIPVDTSSGAVEGLVVRAKLGTRIGIELLPIPAMGARLRVRNMDGVELVTRGVPLTGIVPLHLAPERYRIELVDADEPFSTEIVVDERARTFQLNR